MANCDAPWIRESVIRTLDHIKRRRFLTYDETLNVLKSHFRDLGHRQSEDCLGLAFNVVRSFCFQFDNGLRLSGLKAPCGYVRQDGFVLERPSVEGS
jgi:hypothetical protein